nr:unnamed protein product [Digitaria exilis]
MASEDAAAQGAPAAAAGDRLSGLPDKILFRVMAHFKTWEVVRTSALSKRWSKLWVSATARRLDIRQPHGAAEIELSGKHHDEYPSPEYMSFIVGNVHTVKTRLKILKLIHVRLDGTTLTELCSRCHCLEELELKDCVIPHKTKIQPILLARLTMIRCQINEGLSIHAPNLVVLQFSRNRCHVPWIQNLGLLAASNIYQQAPHMYPEGSSLGSCSLKILKLSHVMLDDTTLSQLCSRCTFLEELGLNDCPVVGKEIRSNSLRCLSMINCKFATGSEREDSDDESNQDEENESDHDMESYEQSGAEDSSDNSDSEIESNQYEKYESDHDGDLSAHSRAEESDVHSDNESDLDEEVESHTGGAHSSSDESDHNIDVCIGKFDDNSDDESFHNDNISAHSGAQDSDDNQSSSGPADEVDGCTVCYQEIAEKYNDACGGKIGGDGLLCILSNVRTLDLSAHSGEVQFNNLLLYAFAAQLVIFVLLMRESKLCSNFKNLKILSLGEWCITPDLDVLASMLQSSPNLEKLFLHLDMANKGRVGFDPEASSFTCTNLKKVEITCCKHDDMVPILAKLFHVNGITHKKIFVRRTTCACDVNRNIGSQAKRKAQTESEKRPEKQIKLGY